jgi:hypothetical protein
MEQDAHFPSLPILTAAKRHIDSDFVRSQKWKLVFLPKTNRTATLRKPQERSWYSLVTKAVRNAPQKRTHTTTLG